MLGLETRTSNPGFLLCQGYLNPTCLIMVYCNVTTMKIMLYGDQARAVIEGQVFKIRKLDPTKGEREPDQGDIMVLESVE